MLTALRFFSPPSRVDFFSTLLKSTSISKTLNQIFRHIFNQQLFDGTLCAPIFGQYLRDDDYYLRHYALSLKKISARAMPINPILANHLTQIAANIISGEQEMHLQYKEYFNDCAEYKPGKAISNYVAYLNYNSEIAELPVALCSILPCFWIYQQLGSQPLHPNQLLFNPYKRWVSTYSSPEFLAATNQLVIAVNQLAQKANAPLQLKMMQAFDKAAKCELGFFDEAYNVPLNINSALTLN